MGTDELRKEEDVLCDSFLIDNMELFNDILECFESALLVRACSRIPCTVSPLYSNFSEWVDSLSMSMNSSRSGWLDFLGGDQAPGDGDSCDTRYEKSTLATRCSFSTRVGTSIDNCFLPCDSNRRGDVFLDSGDLSLMSVCQNRSKKG